MLKRKSRILGEKFCVKYGKRMSRIGTMPITIPAGVIITQSDHALVVKGPKGTLTLPVDPQFKITISDQVTIETDDTSMKARHGLLRSLLYNAVVGVSELWQRKVELVGVGFRAAGGGSEVTLNVGFSHPVKVTAPQDITFTVSDNTKITVSGVDKKQVGEMAAKLRAVRPPEPYKGKGIRFAGEVVRKKAGKAVKAAGAAA